MVESKGVGSIWNKGAWHWEERNYTEFAKDFLTKNWTSIVHEDAGAKAKVSVYEVKELKGSANVSIRKGKQLITFEFTTELYWKAANTEDEKRECQGKVKFHSFDQEDDELNLDEVTCEKPGDWEDGVRQIVRKKITELLFTEAIAKLRAAIKEKDIDEEKLARAAEAEKAALQEYKEVHEKTAEEKKKIFDEAKRKEAEMKAKEAAKPIPQQVQQKVSTQVQGQGSVWNTGSYHWEEKSVQKWADDTLKEILSTFEHKFNDSTLRVTEVKECTGEAGVSIRKGKKIVSFDYRAKLAFECKIGESVCKGTYELPEFSSDEDVSDWEVRSTIEEDKDGLSSVLNQLIRSFAPEALRKKIVDNFVEPLKQK